MVSMYMLLDMLTTPNNGRKSYNCLVPICYHFLKISGNDAINLRYFNLICLI